MGIVATGAGSSGGPFHGRRHQHPVFPQTTRAKAPTRLPLGPQKATKLICIPLAQYPFIKSARSNNNNNNHHDDYSILMNARNFASQMEAKQSLYLAEID